ncbi:MAG: hypothetical protein ACNA8W_13360 [Bradymonadaceae bacterium]
MRNIKHVVIRLFCLVAAMAMAMPAFAGDNDLVLSRFGTFENQGCEPACGRVEPNEQLFHDLVRDLGLVLAPRFASPSDTLGQAGFAFHMMGSMTSVDRNSDHWRTGVENRSPDAQFFTSHLQVRKGLPFSFEVAGNMAHLGGSEMFTLGGDVKWALNEGFYYFPDVAVRGSVNTLLGADDLNMVTAGWDVGMSKAFDISGVMALTPYVGYQQLYIVASSRLLNAYPQDPRPPQYDPNDPQRVFSPEFVFSQKTIQANRFVAGGRLNVWILSFLFETVYSPKVERDEQEDLKAVMQYTFAAGVDF